MSRCEPRRFPWKESVGPQTYNGFCAKEEEVLLMQSLAAITKVWFYLPLLVFFVTQGVVVSTFSSLGGIYNAN